MNGSVRCNKANKRYSKIFNFGCPAPRIYGTFYSTLEIETWKVNFSMQLSQFLDSERMLFKGIFSDHIFPVRFLVRSSAATFAKSPAITISFNQKNFLTLSKNFLEISTKCDILALILWKQVASFQRSYFVGKRL